ncbi:hypothetical protein F0562_020342 [Nyssa sinensis]|uniref:Uncharacterized protein n=1 Tax=Nyssa sinensis TaxID=561372 RepID=A0A5J5BRP0_9ASTE|nr:hypothetical protein F0562_020342 [Nyssa sinensis]
MATTSTAQVHVQPPSLTENKPADVEGQTMPSLEVEVFDYSKRAQWLRAAVLGANDGLLSTASLMVGVGAVRKDIKTMILTGIAGLIAGACSMAIGEFVSVYSQYDIEVAQMKRESMTRDVGASEMEEIKKNLPSPLQAAAASAVAFAVGAFVPLLAAAFIKEYKVRLGVVIAAVSLALLGFGYLGAVLGRAPVVKSSLRVLVGGWVAMVHAQPPTAISSKDLEGQTKQSIKVEVEVFDYSKRAQWLRAAVLGANDGLLSTASLMMGVGAVRKDIKTMILTGIAGLVAGACSMAIGEFVSVYSQYDIEVAQMKRESMTRDVGASEMEESKKNLPSPLQAAVASAAAFAVGAFVPLLAAGFIKNYKVRLGVVVAAVSFALLGFGGLGAVLGRAPVVKSSLRVVIGGWLAMSITFGLTKLIGSTGL